MSSRHIEVVDYDPAWPAAYAREAVALALIFSQDLVGTYHIGSTSVPGLASKPIIDILVVLRETETISRFDAQMEGLGYRVRGECLDAEIPGTPGRFYFSKETKGVRTHQVHACAVGHPQVVEKLAFRDYLRTHPREAAAYAELKRSLALAHPRDTVAYCRGKDACVRSLLSAARQWSAACSVYPASAGHDA